jgi:hypothetical protein
MRHCLIAHNNGEAVRQRPFTVCAGGEPLRCSNAGSQPQPLVAMLWNARDSESAHDYAHFLESSSRSAFCKSSGTIVGMNSTAASKVRNQGSARRGISATCETLTMRKPPRLPSLLLKYAASGFVFSSIRAIFSAALPSRRAALNFSTGIET